MWRSCNALEKPLRRVDRAVLGRVSLREPISEHVSLSFDTVDHFPYRQAIRQASLASGSTSPRRLARAKIPSRRLRQQLCFLLFIPSSPPHNASSNNTSHHSRTAAFCPTSSFYSRAPLGVIVECVLPFAVQTIRALTTPRAVPANGPKVGTALIESYDGRLTRLTCSCKTARSGSPRASSTASGPRDLPPQPLTSTVSLRLAFVSIIMLTRSCADPGTGKKIGSLPDQSLEDTRKAIDVAYDAFSTWKNTSEYERHAVLLKLFK